MGRQRLNAIEFGGWQGRAPAQRVHLAYRLEPDDYRGGDAVQLVIVHRQDLDAGDLAIESAGASLLNCWNLRNANNLSQPMIELNPVRQRIAELSGRLASLRGYL